MNPNYERSQCCWNCQAPGHVAKDCPKAKQLFCSYCLKPGVTTKDCGCEATSSRRVYPRKPDPNFPTCPRALMAEQSPFQMTIGDESFNTFINTMEKQTRVGWMVSTKASIVYGVRREFLRYNNEIVSEEVIPLEFNNRLRNIRCRIMETPERVIILGTDALQCFGCDLKLNGRDLLKLPACLLDHVPKQADRNAAGPSRVRINQPRRPVQSRPPRGHKNPINLNVDELFPFEDKDEPSTSKEVVKKTREERNLPAPDPDYSKWSLMVLDEAKNECEYAAMEYLMNLSDVQLCDVLDLETRDEDRNLE